MSWNETLARRTSERNGLPMPCACATAGMIIVPGGGLLSRGSGETGVTMVTENGEKIVDGPSFVEVFADAPGVRVMAIVAVVDPTSRSAGLIVSCTVVPPADSAPLLGKTVI